MSTKVTAIAQFRTKVLTKSITRPANTTVYSAGDAVSEDTTDNYIEFDNIVYNGGPRTGSIESCIVTSSANQATKPDLELWLFDAAITETPDNDQFAPTDAEMLRLIGVIQIPVADWIVGNPGSGADGNIMCQVEGFSIPFHMASTYSDPDNIVLVGQLVMRNTYTPISGEVFTVKLGVYQD